MKQSLLSGVAFLAMAVSPAGDAFAQEQSDGGLPEIMVTAQRRAQAAQDVGIAMTVIDGADLAKRDVAKINDLQNSVPNLDIEPAFGGGAPEFRLRGVGFQDYASNNSPTVGVYVNEVAYPVPIMTQGMIFDIGQVEALRGPQGTLYGRNTTGGAINFITQQPTDHYTAHVGVDYGSYDEVKTEGYLSGPITDRLKFRLSAASDEGGGWQHNRDTGEHLGDANRVGTRALVDFAATDKLTVQLDVHGGYDKSENTGLYLLDGFTTKGGAGVYIPGDTDHSATGWQIPAQLAHDAGLPLDAKPGVDNDTFGTAVKATYDLGYVKLVNLASYDWLSRREYGDWDATSSAEADTFFGSKVGVWSDEFRIMSDLPGPLKWVAGMYYSKQQLSERYFSDFEDIYGTYARVYYKQDVESISGFGQVDYAITDQLAATAGLRYEHETRDLNGFGTAFGGAQALAPTNSDTSMSPTTGKVELAYKPVTPLMLYVSASEGVKSGGFTTYNTGNSSSIAPFKAEILRAYETGFKADVGRTLEVNGAAFYYKYTDQQVLSAVYGANGPVGRFVNVPSSEIEGLELEGRWSPVKEVSISQALGYSRGQYDRFFDLDTGASRTAGHAIYVDKSGWNIPFPKLTYSGTASYILDLGDYTIEAETNYSYRSEYLSWLGAKYNIPPYWLANLNLTLRPSDDRWSMGFWVHNLFDKQYDLTRNFFTSADIAQPGRPRTIGVRLGYTF